MKDQPGTHDHGNHYAGLEVPQNRNHQPGLEISQNGNHQPGLEAVNRYYYHNTANDPYRDVPADPPTKSTKRQCTNLLWSIVLTITIIIAVVAGVVGGVLAVRHAKSECQSPEPRDAPVSQPTQSATETQAPTTAPISATITILNAFAGSSTRSFTPGPTSWGPAQSIIPVPATRNTRYASTSTNASFSIFYNKDHGWDDMCVLMSSTFESCVEACATWDWLRDLRGRAGPSCAGVAWAPRWTAEGFVAETGVTLPVNCFLKNSTGEKLDDLDGKMEMWFAVRD